MIKLLTISLLFFGCSNTRTIILDGSKSYDPDGKIVWSFYEQVSGPKAVIENPYDLRTRVLTTANGVYAFRLTAMDNDSAKASKINQFVIK